jgi:hypothetical protein
MRYCLKAIDPIAVMPYRKHGFIGLSNPTFLIQERKHGRRRFDPVSGHHILNELAIGFDRTITISITEP